jgi:formate hydrogenlyase regulatory protein HycA
MGLLNLFKRKGIPDSFPIRREEDYHTHYIGKTADGRQFFGYQTFVLSYGITGEDWPNHRKEYVVLYIFDSTGNHLETRHWYAGTTSETNGRQTTEKLEQMIAQLGTVAYCDILVKPFQTLIDGIVFGLVPDEEYQTVDLEPSSTISFHEPWDGEYDT